MTQVAQRDVPWKVLIVDDDELIHDMTKINLRDIEYAGKGVNFLHAHSAREAQQIISLYSDIAVILLDVMMEKDDAGLSLVKFVREEVKNTDVRILLHTGQPGIAPKKEVSNHYQIDGYLDKNIADNDDCYVAVRLALRAYADRLTLKDAAVQDDIAMLEKIAKIYSELFVAPAIFSEYDTVVKEVNRMVHVSQELLAAYALADLRKDANLGTTKAERLSYRDYSALTQIHDIKVILTHTTLQQYQTEYVAIADALCKAAKNFSMISLLPEDAQQNLRTDIRHYEAVVLSE